MNFEAQLISPITIPITMFGRNLSLAIAAILIAVQVSSVAVADDPFDRTVLKIRDRIELKSGAKLVGKFIEETKTDGRTYVVFKCDNGISMKLDKARHVAKLYQLTVADIEYNEMVAAMADTADEHLRAWEWCKSQKRGTHVYRDQIRFHLERVMELDPNDNKVKSRLGFTYLKQQGRWVHKDLYFDANGYERKGAGWMPKLQAKVIQAEADQRLREGALNQEFKIWYNKFQKNRASLKELFEFCNESSVNIVRDAAMEEKNVKLRREFLDAIGQVKSYDAMLALGYFAIEDGNKDLRDRALTLLQQKDFYPQDEVAAKLTGYIIGQKNRAYLLRAAYALGEIGSESSILPLVNVLMTQHQVAALDDPNRMQTTFGNNGLESFSTGGSDPKSKFRVFKNEPVAKALNKITGKSFEYDGVAWRNWYVENHTLYNTSLRD